MRANSIRSYFSLFYLHGVYFTGRDWIPCAKYFDILCKLNPIFWYVLLSIYNIFFRKLYKLFYKLKVCACYFNFQKMTGFAPIRAKRTRMERRSLTAKQHMCVGSIAGKPKCTQKVYLLGNICTYIGTLYRKHSSRILRQLECERSHFYVWR